MRTAVVAIVAGLAGAGGGLGGAAVFSEDSPADVRELRTVAASLSDKVGGVAAAIDELKAGQVLESRRESSFILLGQIFEVRLAQARMACNLLSNPALTEGLNKPNLPNLDPGSGN